MVYATNNRKTTNSGLNHKFKKFIICSTGNPEWVWGFADVIKNPSASHPSLQIWKCWFSSLGLSPCGQMVATAISDIVPLNWLKQKGQQGNKRGFLHLPLSLYHGENSCPDDAGGFFVQDGIPWSSLSTGEEGKWCVCLFHRRKRVRDKRVRDGC